LGSVAKSVVWIIISRVCVSSCAKWVEGCLGPQTAPIFDKGRNKERLCRPLLRRPKEKSNIQDSLGGI
jgi:hypothetical protein